MQSFPRRDRSGGTRLMVPTVLRTDQFDGKRLDSLRRMLSVAYEGDLSPDDWAHACGGLHVLITDGDSIASHAAVVPRTLWVGGEPLRTGYVEAVATAAAWRGRGYGTAVMKAVASCIHRDYELGALCTGKRGFYARTGWESWRGATYVRTCTGDDRRTPEEDDTVMVLRTPRSPNIALDAAIVCDWRDGDVW